MTRLSRTQFINLTLLACAAGLAACSAPQVTPQTANSLQKEKTAVVVAFDRKSIKYDEMVYKVVYNETNTHFGTFEGIWDVDHDFEVRISEALTKLGVPNELAAPALEEVPLKDLRAALGAVNLDEKLQMPADVKQGLVAKGFRYVTAMRSPGFFVQANSFTPSLCQVIYGAWIVIYDLKTDTQEYVDHVAMMGNITIEESPREVEANNLALIKQRSAELFDEFTTPLVRNALGKGE